MTSLAVGENVHIGADAFVRAEGGLSIGDNSHLSRRITIYTMNHEYEGTRLPYDSSVRYRPVVIGRNVWIGMNVTILPGAVIADGAIVGAGSVVGGKLAAGGIYAPPRAKHVGQRDEERYDRLDRDGRYGAENGAPYER
jgi:maltose O-acetyltransferase